MQFERSDAPRDAGQCAAGVDLGKLAVVADEHELDVGLLGVTGELGDRPGTDHPGLIDDEDVAGLWRPALAEIAEELQTTTAAVTGLLHRGLKNLRKALNEDAET